MASTVTATAITAHDNDAREGHRETAEEVEPLAITRWTDDYELFVELPPPAPKKPVPYHAHVTRLSDFGAVTEGVFRVRFKNASGVAAEGVQQGVKRPGIFVFESPAPAAGEYALEMSYEHAGKADVFDCGTITVSDKPPPAAEKTGSPITFLKESQWKIPFGTAWAAQQPIASELELPATVEPAGSDQLTIGATDGRSLLPHAQARARRGPARREGRRDRHDRAHGRRRRLQPPAARRRRIAARQGPSAAGDRSASSRS